MLSTLIFPFRFSSGTGTELVTTNSLIGDDAIRCGAIPERIGCVIAAYISAAPNFSRVFAATTIEAPELISSSTNRQRLPSTSPLRFP